MIGLWLGVLAAAGPYAAVERWEPGTLGALPTPWVVAADPTESSVAVLDASGRLTLVDAHSLHVRWQVPFVLGDGKVAGDLRFGPRGLAVVAGARDEPLRVAIVEPQTGRIEPLGRTPSGAVLLDLRWLDDGDVLTRTREPDPTSPIDGLHERRWGPEPTEREVGAWDTHRRVRAADSDRVFVDATSRHLDRSGRLDLKVAYRVWDNPWDPTTARPLKACPEWSETVRVSADGRVAYTMGQVRCVYDLDGGDVVAWETKRAPFWSSLSPDGARVVERHGSGGRRQGVVRSTRNGEVLLELGDLDGAVFTRDDGLITWSSHRLRSMSLIDGAVRWTVPLDGEVVQVQPAPDARSIALVEQVRADSGARVRVIGHDGSVRATLDDIEGVRGFSHGGRLLFVSVRSDHLGVVDLRDPVAPTPGAHRAGVTALHLPQAGGVLSGDAEGLVRWAHEGQLRAWGASGEVRDLVLDANEVVALTAVEDPDDGTTGFSVLRQPVDDARLGKRATVASDALQARLTRDGKEVLVFSREGATQGPAGRGRAKSLPGFVGRDGGVGPDPETVVVVPGRTRFLAALQGDAGDKAYAWSFSRRGPVSAYGLGIGHPAMIATDGRRVVVLDARGSGKAFDGGGHSDLVVPDGGALCCVAVGGGVIAVATERGAVHVFSSHDGDRIETLSPDFSSEPSAVAVSHDGARIAVGSEGGEVVVFAR